ncbi:MAG: M20/M25/M40 family metallo-hydrolase [Isosphaerales bacterium]
MKRIRTVGVILTLSMASSAATADDQAAAAAVPDAVKGITARELGGHMKFLASDLMRGRDTASPESRLAAEYLASRLSAAGALPAGDQGPSGQTYFQPFPLEVVTPQLEGTSVTLVLEQNGSKRVIPCQFGVDVSFSPWGVTPGKIDAPVVFAGYGQVNTAEQIDDYDGINVKERFVLIFQGRRPKKDVSKADEAKRATPAGRGAPPTNVSGPQAALARGALGIILVQPKNADGQLRPNAIPPLRFSGFGRPSMTLGRAPTAIPTLRFADPICDLILKATELTTKSKPKALEGLHVRFNFAAKKESKEDRNVVGLFPGSDKDKAKEVIIYSAHYDHVGVDDKGEIFNGSDDNASGTSALLEIAEAFGDGPRPARSVAFLWVSGEEKGLFGSTWFSDHVTLPQGYKIVADINLDMVSRNDGKSIGVTPSDKHAGYSTLIPAARAAAKEEGLTIKFNADMFFGSTDSYNFARKGIPVIFFFCGLHADYHRPTDDFTKADFEKAARVARAAYRLGWQVAQDKEAPKKIKAAETKSADSR